MKSVSRKVAIEEEYGSEYDLLGGGKGGAAGIFPVMLELLVGAPGGADEIEDVELFGEPTK